MGRVGRVASSGGARCPAPVVPRRVRPVRRGGRLVRAAPAEVIGRFAAVAANLRAGAAPADAWRRAGVRVDDGVPVWSDLLARAGGDRHVAGAVLAASRLAVRTGAAPAAVLDRVVLSLAEEAEAAAQRRAALAGPRATARVLAWLPAIGLLLGAALGADPLGVLLGGAGGLALVGAAAVLVGVGRAWSGRLLRVAAAAADDA